MSDDKPSKGDIKPSMSDNFVYNTLTINKIGGVKMLK